MLMLLFEDGGRPPKHVVGIYIYILCIGMLVGRDSSVGIQTGYGLDGPGIESH
jgi:hypothetical protein